MQLTMDQVDAFERTGFVFMPSYLGPTEIEALKKELPASFEEDSPSRVLEKEQDIVRSVYGSHMKNDLFLRLTRHSRLVQAARQILDSDVYVYQFKINVKAAFGGDVWPWHQDYIFWYQEDGMPCPRVTSIAIFLDEVTEFNGPMFLIPGSHNEGLVETPAREMPLPGAEANGPYRDRPKWISNLTADLKYSIEPDEVARLVERYGLFAPKGPSGSVLFFHGNIVHASSVNISPHSRNMIVITYNSVENTPTGNKAPRPDFLVSRDYSPVLPLLDDPLFK